MPTHGFGAGWFGRRMRSLGRGGRRGGASLVLVPLGGMVGWLLGRGCVRGEALWWEERFLLDRGPGGEIDIEYRNAKIR